MNGNVWSTSFDENGFALIGFGHAGYSCFIRRNPTNGHVNGYVKVLKEDPLFGRDYDDVIFRNINVNGGMTFGMQLDGMWVFGFDTSHVYDLWWNQEAYLPMTPIESLTRWTDALVIKETRKLAEQLRALSDGNA
jgi:hypothetical protein